MSGNGVRELADAVEEIRTRTNRVTSEAIAARKRLATLGAVIAEAVASGDAVLVRELRDERRNLELIVRDSEGSEKILARKLEVATQQLAVEQLPGALREAENARDRLEATVEHISGETQKYLNLRRVFLETRNRAHQGDGRPSGDVQPRTSLAGAVVRLCRDGFGVQ